MRKKISYSAKTHQFLPETQIGARQSKSIKTTLELLTEQVHTVGKQDNNKVATLLSIDILRAME